jgi:hypothetical protein
VRTIATVTHEPGPVTVHASIGGIAELYAAASAFEPADAGAIKGRGDEERLSMVTTVGAVRRLMAALGKAREPQ